MSNNDETLKEKTVDGKNKSKITCNFCQSKILNPGASLYTKMQFALPRMHIKENNEKDNEEMMSDYWLVEDMYTFENIGVSHTVGEIKYLACADCEKGPLGWHDLSSKKSYIALSRVKNE